MSNELWFHALKVLDNFRSSSDNQEVFKLYEFNDETGILHKHKVHRVDLILEFQKNFMNDSFMILGALGIKI